MARTKDQMRELIEGTRDAWREIDGEDSFVSFMGFVGVVASFYLVWPVEGWVEGLSALVGGLVVGGLSGRVILAAPGGRFLVSLLGNLLKLAVLAAVLGALFYFIQTN